MKYFNTAGPCDPQIHYIIPAAARLPEVRELVTRGFYFVVHAPRQSGKTTSLRELAKEMTAEGKVAVLHFSCEIAQVSEDDFGGAELMVLSAIRHQAQMRLPPECQPPAAWPDAEPGARLGAALSAWAAVCPRPLAVLFDEIDSLRGQSLISVLRQLRTGYADRPNSFPASIVLCGLRDVRDYKAASGGNVERLGTASPFNIKVDSLRLANFTPAEVESLYLQHTKETGQAFGPEAIEKAFELTQGQPWLVNALAREVIEKMRVPPAERITLAHIEEATERLILARATHLDSLVARLSEERVRRVIQPILAGTMLSVDTGYDDDLLYLRDLGLLAPTAPMRIANPIYREVIFRVLSGFVQEQVCMEPRSFILPDGRLNMSRLIDEFLKFWKQHGAVLATGISYHEVAPQLVLMAFLQRVVNGGGFVEREVGIGRGRVDLYVRWPLPAIAEAGHPAKPREWQTEAMELKVWADGQRDPLERGLEQLDEYLASLSADHGHLVIFDRRTGIPPVEERCGIEEVVVGSGRTVVVVRG